MKKLSEYQCIYRIRRDRDGRYIGSIYDTESYEYKLVTDQCKTKIGCKRALKKYLSNNPGYSIVEEGSIKYNKKKEYKENLMQCKIEKRVDIGRFNKKIVYYNGYILSDKGVYEEVVTYCSTIRGCKRVLKKYKKRIRKGIENEYEFYI